MGEKMRQRLGTLQDRLTKELRLAGITTLEDANAFLPGFMEHYNARFAKEPQDAQDAWELTPRCTTSRRGTQLKFLTPSP